MSLHTAPNFSEVWADEVADAPAMTALCRDIPWLALLIGSLRARQTHPSEPLGRWYQRAILRQGWFEVASPWTGRPCRATCSMMLGDQSVFYAFDGEPDLVLGTRDLTNGNPISAIAIPSRRLLIHVDSGAFPITPGHLRALEGLRPVPGATTRPVILTGHPSFAHHAWNHLGALDALLGQPAGPACEVIATFEPLGSLAGMFGLNPAMVHRVDNARLHACNRSDLMIAPLAGTRVTRGTRARLIPYAETRLSGEARALYARIGDRRPVVWLSLRTRDRTATNQTEALVRLCRALLDEAPGAVILLDGFSLPEDAGLRADAGQMRQAVERDNAVAAAIRSDLGGAAEHVIPAVGLRVLESITLAQHVDFYVCHHGTVQHKIGWFADVPGVVHTNPAQLRRLPADWVVDQVEGGVRPTYIPEELVANDASLDRVTDIAPVDLPQNYRFVDVDGFVAFVCAAMRLTVTRE